MNEHFMKHGVFSWNELMTTDLKASKEFYSKLFGWTFEENPMENGEPYACVHAGETMVAGMFTKPKEVPAEVPPHWGAYVTVDDVDATVKQVAELGGTILVPPTDIPKIGRFSVLMDPQGAALNIITYDPNIAGCK